MARALIAAHLKASNGPEPVAPGSMHDLSPYLRGGNFVAGRDDFLTEDQPSSGSLEFQNSSGNLAPLKSSGSFYPQVDAMRSVFLRMATGHTMQDGQAETAAVLTNSPTIFWLLKEPSGTSATDSSGNGRTGTYNGTLAAANQFSPAIGYPTTLRPFDGSNDNVTHTSSGITAATVSKWAEAWVCTASNANQSGYFFKIGSGSTGFACGIGSGNLDTDGREIVIEYAGVRWIPTGVLLTPGWHHVIVMIDGSGIPHLALDGDVVYLEAGGGGSMNAPDGNVYVGGEGTRWFNGWLYGFACGNVGWLTLGRAGAEARAALVGRQVFAGVIASVEPNPHLDEQRARMELNDSLQWLARDDRQPTYPSTPDNDTHQCIDALLTAVSWPATMRRYTVSGITDRIVTPTFAAETPALTQAKALVGEELGRLYSDPYGSFVFEATGQSIHVDANASSFASYNGTFQNLLPRREYQGIHNRVTVNYGGGGGGSVTATDTTSRDKYGLQLLTIDAPFVAQAKAESIRDAALAALKDPRDYVTVVVNSGTVTMLREIIVRQPSHRITLVNSDTGVNGDYRIMSRQVTWNEGGFVTCTWRCSPV